MLYYKKIEWGDQTIPDIWVFDSDTNYQKCLQDGEWLEVRYPREHAMDDGSWEPIKVSLKEWLEMKTEERIGMVEYAITEEEAFMELI